MWSILTLGLASLTAPTGTFQAKTTWSQDIRPIIEKKCVSCHSPGGPAPFNLTTYEEVQRRASLVRYVAILKKMPPTDAFSELGDLAQHAPLTDLDLVKIQDWVREGSLEGTKTPPLIAKPPADPEPPTEMIVAAGPTIRAEGAPYRQSFKIPLKLSASTRLVRFEVIPDEPKAVRHVLLARAGEKTAYPPAGLDPERLIGAWAPGGHAWSSPMGVGMNAGESLEAQVLCQPSGKQEPGGFKLKLWFKEMDGPAAQWLRIGIEKFMVPASDDLVYLKASTTLEEETELTAIHPEMRKYASQLSIRAKTPDGRERTLFSIFSWDPAWIGAYNFAKPVVLPKGTLISAEGVYNNSGHAFGELRTKPTDVMSGPGEGDELFWIHLQLTQP